MIKRARAWYAIGAQRDKWVRIHVDGVGRERIVAQLESNGGAPSCLQAVRVLTWPQIVAGANVELVATMLCGKQAADNALLAHGWELEDSHGGVSERYVQSTALRAMDAWDRLVRDGGR